MQITRNNPDDTSSQTPSRQVGDASSNGQWLEYVLLLTLGLAALMAFSLLLPQGPAQIMQALIGWSLAASVLSVAVLAVLKSLETLLDC